MGANDTLEQLEAAREENIRLEADNARLERENVKLKAARVAVTEIHDLLGLFVSRQYAPGQRISITIHDHLFAEEEFWPRLFDILDKEASNG